MLTFSFAVEVLECLATWKEGAQHYLVGKLTHSLATTDEDEFRCFMYEMSSNKSIVQVAQSGDASCTGLSSPTEGAKTMTLTRGTVPTPPKKINKKIPLKDSQHCPSFGHLF